MNTVRWFYCMVNVGARFEWQRSCIGNISPAPPNPPHKTTLKVLKHLMVTGCLISRTQYSRPTKVEREVQTVGILSYALTYYPNSRTREISESCRLSKSRVWKNPKRIRCSPYRQTPHQALLDEDAEKYFT